MTCDIVFSPLTTYNWLKPLSPIGTGQGLESSFRKSESGGLYYNLHNISTENSPTPIPLWEDND